MSITHTRFPFIAKFTVRFLLCLYIPSGFPPAKLINNLNLAFFVCEKRYFTVFTTRMSFRLYQTYPLWKMLLSFK